jgi:hypothetical protein
VVEGNVRADEPAGQAQPERHEGPRDRAGDVEERRDVVLAGQVHARVHVGPRHQVEGVAPDHRGGADGGDDREQAVGVEHPIGLGPPGKAPTRTQP